MIFLHKGVHLIDKIHTMCGIFVEESQSFMCEYGPPADITCRHTYDKNKIKFLFRIHSIFTHTQYEEVHLLNEQFLLTMMGMISMVYNGFEGKRLFRQYDYLVCIVCYMICHKFSTDIPFDNASFSLAFCVSSKSINSIELEILKALDWKIINIKAIDSIKTYLMTSSNTRKLTELICDYPVPMEIDSTDKKNSGLNTCANSAISEIHKEGRSNDMPYVQIFTCRRGSDV